MEDKLESGARADQEGPRAPGWSVEDGKPSYSPKKVKGGRTSGAAADEDTAPSQGR